MHEPGANRDESSGVPSVLGLLPVLSVLTALEPGRVAAGVARGDEELKSSLPATTPITTMRRTSSAGARP
jgi:hypothetical protein